MGYEMSKIGSGFFSCFPRANVDATFRALVNNPFNIFAGAIGTAGGLAIISDRFVQPAIENNAGVTAEVVTFVPHDAITQAEGEGDVAASGGTGDGSMLPSDYDSSVEEESDVAASGGTTDAGAAEMGGDNVIFALRENAFVVGNGGESSMNDLLANVGSMLAEEDMR